MRGLNHHLEYTGGLLLGNGFIRELYVHMGFHPAWKYETVMELVFEGGVLVKEADRSAEVVEIRRRFATDPPPSDGATPSREEIAKFIDRAFDRRYGR